MLQANLSSDQSMICSVSQYPDRNWALGLLGFQGRSPWLGLIRPRRPKPFLLAALRCDAATVVYYSRLPPAIAVDRSPLAPVLALCAPFHFQPNGKRVAALFDAEESKPETHIRVQMNLANKRASYRPKYLVVATYGTRRSIKRRIANGTSSGYVVHHAIIRSSLIESSEMPLISTSSASTICGSLM